MSLSIQQGPQGAVKYIRGATINLLGLFISSDFLVMLMQAMNTQAMQTSTAESSSADRPSTQGKESALPDESWDTFNVWHL